MSARRWAQLAPFLELQSVTGWLSEAKMYAKGNRESPGRVKRACALQFVCYNADILNRLFLKGLPVKLSRRLSIVRLVCVLTAVLSAGIVSPSPSFAQETAGRRVTHVVRRGETLSSIARRYGTSVAAIKDLNGLSGDAINAGRRPSG